LTNIPINKSQDLYESLLCVSPENLETIGGFGKCFKRGDAADLARVLAELFNDPAGARKIGGQARERAKQLYSWDAVVDKMEEVYRQVLSGR
jgi:glycosyltransferase involved in cell wall biosynthesis